MASPVYLYDPRDENANSYSDWEYYSDDYYDDDPQLVKDAEGDVPREKTKTPAVTRKSKKRKLETESEDPEQIPAGGTRAEMKSLRRWMKGTMWRKPSPGAEGDPKCYEPGRARRVALLDDWREVFEADQPLETKRRRADLESFGSEEEDLNLDIEMGHEVGLESLESIIINGANLAIQEDSTADEVELSRKGKRRRISSHDEPPSQPADTVMEGTSKTVSRPELKGEPAQADSGLASTSTTLKNRKRKAGNIDTDGTQDSLPRSKRVASTNANVKGKAKVKEKPPPVPTTRATRSKKQ